MSHRAPPTLALVSIIVVTLSGCTFFSQKERDVLACEGMESVITADRNADQKATPLVLASNIRREALQPASARLGQDIIGLARVLERTQVPGPGVNESQAAIQLNTFSQRISDRCVELAFSSGVANLAYTFERPVATDDNTVLPEAADPRGSAETPDPNLEAQPGLLASPQNLRSAAEVPDGYNRDLFDHWIDADGDGCDTRREVLIQESLTPLTIGPGCSLNGGEWFSAYDGVATTNPSDFDIDHFVPLKEAWASGAYAWSEERRRDFANDLANEVALIAVTAGSNRSKGANDPAGWLPPETGYHCAYVAQWIEVKIFWDLSADVAEISALEDVLAGC